MTATLAVGFDFDHTLGLDNGLEVIAFYRLAAELAPSITEDMSKAENMMQMYRDTLNSAQAQQECDDYLRDEAGSTTWVDAGRYGWGRGRW